MKYMILFVPHDTSKLNLVLNRWEEVGVSGVTVFASTGIGRLKAADMLREDLPLMPSLEDLIETPERFNRTLMTLVENDEMIDRVVEATEEVVGKLDDPNTGILAVLPLSRVYGLVRHSDQ